MKYVLLCLIVGTSGQLPAQWVIDPDWNLTARDSRQHFLAGASIQLAGHLIIPKAKPWQRLVAAGAIALAYELGQESTSRAAKVNGSGYGLGPKDWLLGMLGACVVEGAWHALKRE